MSFRFLPENLKMKKIRNLRNISRLYSKRIGVDLDILFIIKELDIRDIIVKIQEVSNINYRKYILGFKYRTYECMCNSP